MGELAMAASLLSAAGTIMSGKAQAEAAADAAAFEEQQAEINEENTRIQALADENKAMAEFMEMQSAQLNLLAAGDGDLSSGTLTAFQQAENKKFSTDTRLNKLAATNKQASYRMAAANARRGRTQSYLGSVLKGVGTVASTGYDVYKSG